MRAFIIVNPRAGSCILPHAWQKKVLPEIKKKLSDFEFAFTKQKSDGTRLAREAIESGFDLIISMGGDGTLNEVVNGFFEIGLPDAGRLMTVKPINPAATLGILPFGSGGDFIRSLHFKRDYRLCLQSLINKKVVTSDVVLARFDNTNIKPRLFINIADVGLVAAIMKRVNSKNRKLPAFYRYITGTFQGFHDHKLTTVRLTIDSRGAQTVRLNNLLIANGEYFGGGMRPAAGAKINDGKLEVVVLKDTKFKTFLTRFPMIYFKKKYGLAGIVDHYQASQVRVESLEVGTELETEMDGETYGTGNVTFTVVPGALRIKV